MSHNGWTNYETWLTALWLDQYQVAGQQHHAGEPQLDADGLREYVETLVDESGASEIVLDLVNAAVSEINWQEIADNHREAYPQQQGDTQ